MFLSQVCALGPHFLRQVISSKRISKNSMILCRLMSYHRTSDEEPSTGYIIFYIDNYHFSSSSVTVYDRFLSFEQIQFLNYNSGRINLRFYKVAVWQISKNKKAKYKTQNFLKYLINTVILDSVKEDFLKSIYIFLPVSTYTLGRYCSFLIFFIKNEQYLLLYVVSLYNSSLFVLNKSHLAQNIMLLSRKNQANSERWHIFLIFRTRVGRLWQYLARAWQIHHFSNGHIVGLFQ